MRWPPLTTPRGGPMVDVPWFGPFYPPDAEQKGKVPSDPSDVFVALKRTLGRLGAWPWDPDSYDNRFSNAFAHGSSSGAGIAGVQRWAKIDDTGWVGQQTWNFLRSVRVPQGRTHAGEPAMDSLSQQMVWNAQQDAAKPKGDTVRERALKNAVREIGVKESPAGSNQTMYGQWYGENGVPWCAIFATWCYDQNDDSPTFVSIHDGGGTNDRYDYVPYIVSDARNGRFGLAVTSTPMPGDLVCYDWARDGEYDHVGLFEQWTGPTTFTAVEGNTSTSDNSNGGEVMRRTRDVNGQGTVFVRVAEP